MDEQLKQIGERLRGLRDVLDIPVSEMAETIGISSEKYEKLEQGEADITISNLMKIAKKYGISTEELIFATVSIPISDWWGGSHTVKRKKIEQQKALDQLHDNAQLLTIRMQKAQNDVQEAYQQYLLAQQSVEQTTENLRLNRDYYNAGTSRMSDLLEAQLLYQQSLDKRVDAFADLQNRLLDFRQATGQ